MRGPHGRGGSVSLNQGTSQGWSNVPISGWPTTRELKIKFSKDKTFVGTYECWDMTFTDTG